MAANFWRSTHSSLWILESRDVVSCQDRDRENGLSDVDIRALRIHFSEFIKLLVKTLNARQRVAATAITYFRRLYVKQSFRHYDPRVFALSSVFLASKVEESPEPVHLLRMWDILGKMKKQSELAWSDGKVPYWGSRSVGSTYSICEGLLKHYTTDHVTECEFHLVQCLKQSLIVFHPYRPLAKYTADADVKDLFETAWCIVNDSYMTDLVLTKPPYLIALAALYIAAVYAQRPVQQWFSSLNVDTKEVAATANEILDTYEFVAKHLDKREQVVYINDLVRRLPHFGEAGDRTQLPQGGNGGKRPLPGTGESVGGTGHPPPKRAR